MVDRAEVPRRRTLRETTPNLVIAPTVAVAVATMVLQNVLQTAVEVASEEPPVLVLTAATVLRAQFFSRLSVLLERLGTLAETPELVQVMVPAQVSSEVVGVAAKASVLMQVVGGGCRGFGTGAGGSGTG
ncbi:hypothetical protein MRX96_012901 [Rhipicephalus microplus]